MSSTIKLKKSSIAGRVPSASDLEYGEIAINIADGKLYFKNSSNVIQSFEAGGHVDSAAVLSLIDSSHIQARQIDEGLDSDEVNALIASGLQDAFSRILVDGQFDVVADSTQDGLTFAAGNNIIITTAPNDDTITFTTTAIGADSVTSLIDSSYVQARQDFAYASLTGAPTSLSPDGVDSAATIALIDSAYVQARQLTTSNFDSSSAIGLIDSAYVQARQADLQRDSAFVTNIVDAAYVQARQVDLQRDSAFITGLIDSSYIQARDNVGGTTVNTLNRSVFTYTTTANQTVFTGADSDGNTLAFNDEVDVYLNGILLKQSDYVLSGGNTVTLDLATSAGNILTVVNYGASIATLPSQRTYEYTATANQTTFSGSDDNGNTLSYDVDKLNVYVNGILLATEDYVATNTTSVVLTTGAAVDDIVQVVAWKADIFGELDSAGVTNLIDSAYIQARQLGSEITIQDEGSSLSTAATTLNFVGSAVTASGTGTTKTITITQAEGGTDSATVSNIITTDVDSAYVQARQSTTDLTNYRTVTQIQSMIDSDIDAIVDAAPGALDTLNELAAALGDDANFSTTVTNTIAAKVDSAQAIVAVTSSDLDMGGNKVLFGNVYSQTSDLPSASTYHGMFAHVHATGKGYFAHAGNWIELANHSQLANSSNWDSAYGWGDHSTQGYLTDAIDSARVTSLIDSSYVQARQTAQDFAFSSLTGTPTTIAGYGITDAFDGAYSSLTGVPSTFAPSGVDSNATFAIIDSAYVQARQSTASDFDSASAISLIDSAYVQARQTQVEGTDSAAVIGIIDSNYVQARQANASPGATTIVTTNYIADSGDTTFAASYTIGKLNVYLNGILLVDSDDYTASNGNSVVLTSAADSGDTIQIITYVSQAIGTLDSAGVTSLIDSAYVNARVAAGTDSSTVSNIILSDVDSAYVQARQTAQDFAFSSLTGTPTTISGYGITDAFDGAYSSLSGVPSTFAPTGVDSSATISLIDSAYVQARQDFAYSSLTGTPTIPTNNNQLTNGAGYITGYTVTEGDVTAHEAALSITESQISDLGTYLTSSDLTSYRTATQIESMIDSNVNAVIDAAPGALDTLNELAAALGDDANFSTTVTNSIAAKIDSAQAVAIIDSAHVALHSAIGKGDVDFGSNKITYSNVYSQTSDLPSASDYHGMFAHVHATGKGYFAHGGNWIELANNSQLSNSSNWDTAYGWGDHSAAGYLTSAIDSSGVIGLVDSAYIQARQTSGGGTDSASVIALIDSSYVQARQSAVGSGATSISTTTFTATAGQTTFTTNYTVGKISVYLNGILLVDTSDYTATNGTSVVLNTAAVANDILQVVKYTTDAVQLYRLSRSVFTFTATANQTVFTGTAGSGGTLSFGDEVDVYINGILLPASDYTLSGGDTVTLASGTGVNNLVTIVDLGTTASTVIDSAGITDIIDSAYIQARQSTASDFDSSSAISLIDSAYVQARQTAQDFAYSSLTGTPTIPTNNNQLTNGAGYITGYTVTESDVTGHEAALTITESQISDLGTYLTSSSLTNYRTVTQIESMIDSNVNAVIDAAPNALNTLNELAAALGDDANFSTTVTNSIAAKLPLAGGTMTGAIAMGSNKITGLGTPTASADAATKAYADTMLPLAGGTMSGNIDLDNNELLNINYLRFNDPGVEEGIGWTGGNGWQIFEAPNAMTNGSGNLQFTTGNSTSDRMMTIDTNGNLELPTGRLTQVSDDPLRIRSSTNASPVSIEFSDLSTSSSYSQYGTISYTHSDAASTSAGISGANEVFIIEGTEAVTGIKLDGRLLVTGTSEFEGDVDFGSNKITYSNVYSQTSDLPSASTYHGMFAHVHATGKGYFAHSGNWVELANNSDVPTDVSDLTDTTSLLGTGGLDSDATTNLIDSNYIAARTGNNSLTVNYVPDRKYARLTMSSNQTGVSSTTVALTTFNTRDVDTSPNNALTSTLADGKFIIPAGVSKIRLSASCKTSSVTDQVTMTFWKNGDFFTGASNIDVSSTGRDHAAAFTGIIDVVENDYFQIAMFSQNSRTAEQDELSWFELEVIEGSMLNTAVASTIELSNLSNVDSASPSDGQALVWDSDNNYWKPGTVASGSGGGGTVDSADIIAIVDSDYIQARQSSTGSSTITSGGAFAARTYHYTASANQTVFSGADDDGETLTITDSDANVYLNGILLKRTTDYTVGSNSITLQSGADSDNIISIVAYTGNHLDSNYISSRVSGGATTTTFTATANQTVFSGGGFTYKPDNLTVFYNGILLLDSDDYTATDGTSITLTSGATAGHKLTAVAYTMGTATGGVDVTTRTFTATAGQTIFNNLDDDGNRLSYNVDNTAIYLNGILLSPADYTANNASSVVLTEAADSGNILTVMSYMGDQATGTIASWSEVSNTYTASHGDKLFVDVSSAAATVTLPASASMGDEVRIIDATGNAATNNITINKNGHNINGAADNLILDVNRAAIGLVYYNVAQGWVLMER